MLEELAGTLPPGTHIVAIEPDWLNFEGRCFEVEIQWIDEATGQVIKSVKVVLDKDDYLPQWDAIQSLIRRINRRMVSRRVLDADKSPDEAGNETTR